MAGSNDVSTINEDSRSPGNSVVEQLTRFVKTNRHTNFVVVNLFHRHDLPPNGLINREIKRINEHFNILKQERVPIVDNTLQLDPQTQQISATELNGERCQNVDAAATHPPATVDCGHAPAEGRTAASSTGDTAALPTLMIKDGLKLLDLNSFPHLPLSESKLEEFDNFSTLVATAGSRYGHEFSIYHQNIRSVRHKVSELCLTLVGRWGVGGNPTVFMCNIFLLEKFRGRWGGHL
ncbi:hypothetical protein J6590_065333 [Homalodisca vitripennis]|nr:hypothetical protein J6590_065333 [Homalodisca vitripennis]